MAKDITVGILLIVGSLFALWLYDTGRASNVIAAVRGQPGPSPLGTPSFATVKQGGQSSGLFGTGISFSQAVGLYNIAHGQPPTQQSGQPGVLSLGG